MCPLSENIDQKSANHVEGAQTGTEGGSQYRGCYFTYINLKDELRIIYIYIYKDDAKIILGINF